MATVGRYRYSSQPQESVLIANCCVGVAGINRKLFTIMASRPKGFGLTRELENKKRQEYDESLAEKVCTWFNAVCQDSEDSKFAVDFQGSFTWESVHQKLKDGKLILAVANKISPANKKKIQTLNSPFKLMENTGNFLSIADKIGVSATDLFQTSSLYEGEYLP